MMWLKIILMESKEVQVGNCCFGKFLLLEQNFLVIFRLSQFSTRVIRCIMFSRVIVDLDVPGKWWFSQEREQRGVCSAVSDCVCVLALRLQPMNLMKMNITQGLDDASSSLLNSHTYSRKGHVQQDPSIKPGQHHSELECMSDAWVVDSVLSLPPLVSQRQLWPLFTPPWRL